MGCWFGVYYYFLDVFFFSDDGYNGRVQDVDVVTQTQTVTTSYGEEHRTTNQLTEEGRMSC